jgi:NADP-dependent 3-hydroxy acid dehydrogenase YdfG
MEPEDIAEAIFACHSLPENVNVNRIELMPLGQATGTFTGKHVD